MKCLLFLNRVGPGQTTPGGRVYLSMILFFMRLAEIQPGEPLVANFTTVLLRSGVSPLVSRDAARAGELLVTVLARERFLPRVRPFVFVQVARPGETFPAVLATVRFHLRVHHLVDHQTASVGKVFTAYGALVELFFGVDASFVDSHIAGAGEFLWAILTTEWHLFRMFHPHMRVQVGGLRKASATVFARVGFLFRVGKHMSPQVTRVKERFEAETAHAVPYTLLFIRSTQTWTSSL